MGRCTVIISISSLTSIESTDDRHRCSLLTTSNDLSNYETIYLLATILSRFDFKLVSKNLAEKHKKVFITI